MSRRRVHRWICHLALGAALSLALLPAAGRIAGAGAAHAGHMASVATGGQAHADTDDGARQPSLPVDTASADCGYCPLLASALPAPRWAPVAVPPMAPDKPGLRRADARDAGRYPTGLGSRGPPHA
ncbi:DUF2946 domain-containing protein [Luteimonas yindakuii]|uniref:DUF2946 domain-containing protein n=1 Tax=Luteimonas yindakuii TaxID=2565782 RepID=A0A4Z1RKU8_9GAMM|nr:DUF2946 family protein [Luteimonas yindakuii]TKS54739.1 DUF2946 domain-containing protein [Luteimonas yindakuii]